MGKLQATQGFVQAFTYSANKLISCIEGNGISQLTTRVPCSGKAQVSVCQMFLASSHHNFSPAVSTRVIQEPGISNVCSWTFPSPRQTTHKVLGWWVGMEELAPERCPCTPLLPLAGDDQSLKQCPKSDAWPQPNLLEEITFPNHPHEGNSFSSFCSTICVVFLSTSPLKARSFFWDDHIRSSADLKCWSLSLVWLFAAPWTVTDCGLSGSSAHGILQARIPEWVAFPFFRGSSQPRDGTQVSRTAGRFFTIWATRRFRVHPNSWTLPQNPSPLMQNPLVSVPLLASLLALVAFHSAIPGDNFSIVPLNGYFYVFWLFKLSSVCF